MSIELQIRSSILGAITARAVQNRLRTACFAPIASAYIDHADVDTTPVVITPATNSVHLRVPLAVFVVNRENVLAAPNGIPVGATTTAGAVAVIFEMAITGVTVSLRCIDADLGTLNTGLGPAAPAAKAALINASGSPITTDLTSALKQLNMPTPASSRVELVADVIVFRFGPIGNAVSHLFSGQDWGIFLDGASVENLALSKVPADLKSKVSLDAHWRPAGDIPHVDIDYAGKVPVPDPFTAAIDGVLRCDFSLTPTITKFLRTTINWSLHINLGVFVPGFIDNMVEDIVEGYMDPTKFGGTPVGDHSFRLKDSTLPNISFGGARFDYVSTFASAAGMTVGGTVSLLLNPGKETLQPKVTKLGLPSRLYFCSLLAKSGSGAPPKTVSLSEVLSYGSVWLENLGSFCNVEILSPNEWIMPYIKLPTDTSELRIGIPSAVAFGITKPVRIIVRTARGVRLVDLGTPPPAILDIHGNVTNALINYIDDCLYIDLEHGIKWVSDGGLLNQSVVNPPLEHPDWTTYIDRYNGIIVQLVTLTSLEPGELIQFRSSNHAVDITADRKGQAIIPVFRPITNQQEPANLIRVNRRSIAGHFYVQTINFVNQASLPAGNKNYLNSLDDGTARLTTEFEDYVDVHEVGLFGAPVLLKHEVVYSQEQIDNLTQPETSHLSSLEASVESTVHNFHNVTSNTIRPLREETALNPQPLPPQEIGALENNLLLIQKINVPGITSLISMPGFTDAPIKFATMNDGSTLIIDFDEKGSARVAGVFTGPVGTLDTAGNWAFNRVHDRISIYRVTREAKCYCGV